MLATHKRPKAGCKAPWLVGWSVPMTAPSHALSTAMCSVLFKSVAFIPDRATTAQLGPRGYAGKADDGSCSPDFPFHYQFGLHLQPFYNYTTSCLLEHPDKVIIGLNLRYSMISSRWPFLQPFTIWPWASHFTKHNFSRESVLSFLSEQKKWQEWHCFDGSRFLRQTSRQNQESL